MSSEILKVYKDELDPLQNDPYFLHKCRTVLEKHVYGHLNREYGKLFDTFWNSTPPPKQSNKTILIVERRCHENLWFILRNAHYYCPEYSITIHCSNENLDYCIKQMQPHQDLCTFKVVFDNDCEPSKGIYEYNEYMKKLSTWESIDADFILTMEMDTYLINKIPQSAYDFDYVASSYEWSPYFAGGGGLSLRTKQLMLEVCKNIDTAMYQMQDMYVSNGCLELGYTWANCYESCFLENSIKPVYICGFHQWWTFLEKFLIRGDSIDEFLTCIVL